jgi:hypothetical protein
VRSNYLLIDYENVHPKNLALLNGHTFKVIVFFGAHQTKIPVELAAALQPFGKDAEYAQISGHGSNALDFHIAFMVGELSHQDPTAYFHIISKDTGFDPLMKYAKQRGLHVFRYKDVADIPILRISNAKTISEKVEAIVKNLALRGSGRPRKEETLTNTINAIFQKALSEQELKQLIEELVKQQYITIENSNVSYHLPTAA